MSRRRAGNGRGPGSLVGDAEHLPDRSDPGDRLLGEIEAESDGPDELAVDVDGASAHPGDDARRFQVPALEAGDDDVPLGGRVVQDPEDLDIELLDRVALENGPALSLLAGLDLGDGQGRTRGRLDLGGRGEDRGGGQEGQDGRAEEGTEAAPPAGCVVEVHASSWGVDFTARFP